VGFAGWTGVDDAPESAAPFVGDKKVIAGTVSARFTARRTGGDELSAVQAGLLQAVKVKAHGGAGR
jgi:hypothetical protein